MADRLKKLKELEAYLYTTMQDSDAKTIAPIAKQYRETIREIEEIEGATPHDEIADILSARQAEGKSGAVRKNRTEI